MCLTDDDPSISLVVLPALCSSFWSGLFEELVGGYITLQICPTIFTVKDWVPASQRSYQWFGNACGCVWVLWSASECFRALPFVYLVEHWAIFFFFFFLRSSFLCGHLQTGWIQHGVLREVGREERGEAGKRPEKHWKEGNHTMGGTEDQHMTHEGTILI